MPLVIAAVVAAPASVRAAEPPSATTAEGTCDVDPSACRASATPTPNPGGICEIDPSACPTEGGIPHLADRQIKMELYPAPRHLRRHRLEANASWSMSLTEGGGPHVGAQWYVEDRLALGLDATLLSGKDDLNPFSTPSFTAAANASWVPWSVPLPKARVRLDIFLVGGAGAVAVRSTDAALVPRPALDLGVGSRWFVNREFALTLEARSYATTEPAALFLATAGLSFFL